MLSIQPGQCGTCTHFGGESSNESKLVQIRTSRTAEPDTVEPCGHPENAPRQLRVSPVSTCAGYAPAGT